MRQEIFETFFSISHDHNISANPHIQVLFVDLYYFSWSYNIIAQDKMIRKFLRIFDFSDYGSFSAMVFDGFDWFLEEETRCSCEEDALKVSRTRQCR